MALAAHAGKNDALTSWWRGVSLRAKVTGVTVAVLAIGLVSAGVGTLAFLRNTLAMNLDAQVQQLAETDAVSSVFTGWVTESGDDFEVRSDATAYFVAVYGPDGRFLTSGGGNSAPEPEFPQTFTLAQATIFGTSTVFDLNARDGGAGYRAAVGVEDTPSGVFYTQLVALPTAPNERFLAAFLGIYSFLAIITVIASAFLVRWIVTLTFRSLGQVEATADAIAAGDFSLRMTDIEPATTEVGRLKAAINAMLGRIDAALSERDATVRQMRRFIGDASHELRTPLVTVRGYAELYRMGAISGEEQIDQSMERIEKEAIRMGVLVEDLLALARLDERRGITLAPVDLRPIARDAALDARAAAPLRTVIVRDTTTISAPVPLPQPAPAPEADAPEHPPSEPARKRPSPTTAIGLAGATLSRFRRRPKQQPPAEPARPRPTPPPAAQPPARPPAAPIVTGDEDRIRQVVTNLLGNARRYSPEDSPIEISVGVDAAAGTGWIAVSDHGEGVPPQIRDKIFQRFWRADTSRTRETGGSGLGLSIVAAIVETLHGSIKVTDTPGGGATFTVAFPLVGTGGPSDTAPSEATSPALSTSDG
ncbi:HAMP domain-containing histidine kinase [Microbacterium sp. zg.Y1090]|uniref:sensor histidine kinase n=1 Tax=Microbacterium TaxID=33882 RepID=UPI00214AA12D|nr:MULTISPECIES: HAMP domain-containing sensor histidine kinase [unclassified Microbacterium]MCR2812859.1 HAMP domain-containing histidine kinase [Microbacterium sp. zg.Y1084]MCR2817338.1 HAMP domain-containing histidine kinase [Microbacterium sp. zg.Y1090]MDL5486002.1 HAMP domain-containing sensor histidine kinase [Microbacterium sp. zg-Y1211]WIM29174.1 HAMP domain-containing sensor histidine kinase [Microbacterium sp. zg-Y1090]